MNDPKQLGLFVAARGLPVSWTLPYEMHFYVVAAIALGFGRRGIWVLAVWAIGQIFLVAATSLKLVSFYLFFHPLTLEFVFGLAVGYFAPRRRLPLPGLFMVLGLAAPILLNLSFGALDVAKSDYGRIFGYGLPSAVLVWATMSHEAANGSIPRWAVWLGDISYSLYMWHSVVYAALALILASWLASDAGAASFILVGLPMVIIVSAASFAWVERPVNRWATTVHFWGRGDKVAATM